MTDAPALDEQCMLANPGLCSLESEEDLILEIVNILAGSTYSQGTKLTIDFLDLLLSNGVLSSANFSGAGVIYTYEADGHAYTIALGQKKSDCKYPLQPYARYFASNLVEFLMGNSIETCNQLYGTGQPVLLSPFKKQLCVLENGCKARSVNKCGKATGKADLEKLLLLLEDRDILDIMGVSSTIGSIDILPPPVQVLIDSFNMQHSPKSKLSVGARALAKHCHRSSDGWWGECTGSEQCKNASANKTLLKVMRDIVWINLHCLPHNVNVLELRCSYGYGVRWKCDGSEFRGFLEPQIENGHAVKWRH